MTSLQERSVRFAALLLVMASVRFAKAEPVIYGDERLLETVAAALETNRFALRQGGCRIDMAYNSSYSDTTAVIDLVWSGESSFSSYEYSEEYHEGDRPVYHAAGSQVVSEGVTRTFVPEGRLCTTWPIRRDWTSFRYACPPDICFHTSHHPDYPWSDYFDGWEDGESIEIEQAGDEIVVKLSSLKGGYVRLTFSVSHGCNVILCELYDDTDTFVSRQEQRWEIVDGVWVPVVSKHVWHFEEMDAEFEMRISDFEADPLIEKNTFSVESLQLPRGTALEVRDEMGRTIAENGFVGSRNEDELDALEKLVNEARTNGFARPDRTYQE